jgi:hypothetical protein
MSRDRLRELHSEGSAATLYAQELGASPGLGRKGSVVLGDAAIRLDVLDGSSGAEGEVTAFLLRVRAAGWMFLEC